MRTVWLIEGGQFDAQRGMFNINPKNVAFTHKWRAKRHIENIIEVNEGTNPETSEYEIGNSKLLQIDYSWFTKEGFEVKERLIAKSLELR